MADNSSVRAYNSWWQVRSDTWSRLGETSGQLADTSLRDEPADGMAETTSGLLDDLAPIEQYWAFPGPEVYRRDLDTPEIHGDNPQAGYRVYPSKAVEIASMGR
jgi:hypothetical protein